MSRCDLCTLISRVSGRIRERTPDLTRCSTGVRDRFGVLRHLKGCCIACTKSRISVTGLTQRKLTLIRYLSTYILGVVVLGLTELRKQDRERESHV